jgi:MYXO-CTERM domain-containing protein
MDVRCDGTPLDFELRRRDERVACDKAEYNSGAGNVNVVTFVQDWASRPLHDPRAFALTTVWHNRSTGEVYDADIEINEDIGVYTECDPRDGCDDGRIDLANVLTHEIGHFFTIAHSDNNISTMWWMADPGDIDKRVLRTDDVNAICSVYPPGSLTAACDFLERGGFSGECGGGDGGGCSASHVSVGDAPVGWVALVVMGLGLVGRRRRWS